MIAPRHVIFLACVVLAVWGADARAAVITSEPRIALVVGNSAYRNAPPLRNPVNDARDMAKALRELGFQVIQLENGTKQQLERAIGQFSAKLTDSSVGLFYYSGHGIQENGHNYLIPVEAELATEGSVMLETVDVDVVLQLMNLAQTRVNLVILDACRSNPFERRFRGLGRGLAPVEQAPRGTLIAYSTAPGKVASDGDGANGLYTAELLKAIRQPGLTVEQIFKTVRIGVSTASNDNQTPWEASSLTGEFFFKPLAPVVAAPSPPPAPAPAANPDAADIAFWNSIKDASQAAPFETYLKRFPKGLFSDLAQFKIAELSKPGANAAPRPAAAALPPTQGAQPPPTASQQPGIQSPSTQGPVPEDAQKLVDAGIEAYARGHLDEAIQKLKAAIEIRDTARAEFYLGEAYFGKDDKSAAAAAYQRSIKLAGPLRRLYVDAIARRNVGVP